MDKASASGAGDSRFESWAGHMCAPRFRPVKSGDVPRHNSVALVDGAAATETLRVVSKCAHPGATAFSVGRRRFSWSMGEAVGSLVWDGTRAQLPLAMIKRHSDTITTPGNT